MNKDIDYGTIVRLEQKLHAEVNRLHDDVEGRRGSIELDPQESDALLLLVQKEKRTWGTKTSANAM